MLPFIDLKTQQEHLAPRIRAAFERVLAHGRYIFGPEIEELEAALARRAQVPHAIGVSSGTDALLMALMALDIGPGDEVITVPYTWISTAEVIVLAGAQPVFVDIYPDTWNIDPNKIEAAITPRTRAILPVGIYGQAPEMDAINALAARHHLHVIEDAAQSFGASYHGRPSGGLSPLGTTSFFPSKPLGCYGDGGAIFCQDERLHSKMVAIRNHGQTPDRLHRHVGLNGRLDSIQAGILLAKLESFDAEIEARHRVAGRYTSALHALPITCPSLSPGHTSVWAQYTILVEEPEALREHLRARGIPSVRYYATPLHRQPVFERLGYPDGTFPIAESVSRRCLSLPMSPWLAPTDQDRIIEAIHGFFEA